MFPPAGDPAGDSAREPALSDDLGEVTLEHVVMWVRGLFRFAIRSQMGIRYVSLAI